MSTAEIMQSRLAGIAKLIEAHLAAVLLLEHERIDLQMQFARRGL